MRISPVFPVVLSLLISVSLSAQKKVTWETLSEVEYEQVYLEDEGTYFDKPTFSENIIELEGENIEISGYVVPVDVGANYYVLSAYPYQMCFFCGNAGPETVMDLEMKADKRFEKDEKVTFTGKLSLNRNDAFRLTYVLEGAKPVD